MMLVVVVVVPFRSPSFTIQIASQTWLNSLFYCRLKAEPAAAEAAVVAAHFIGDLINKGG